MKDMEPKSALVEKLEAALEVSELNALELSSSSRGWRERAQLAEADLAAAEEKLDAAARREAVLRAALSDAVEVAANYYMLFHDWTWQRRVTKWRAALG